MKEKNILELARRMNLISVDDMCKYTITQLVVMIANKVNELIDEVGQFESDVVETVKTQSENIQYLLGEGLHLEVENILDGWIQDGTFDTLINQTALKTVNDRLDETNARLSQTDQHLNSIGQIAIRLDGELDDTQAIQRVIDSDNPLYVDRHLIVSDTIRLKLTSVILGKGKNSCSITMTNNNKWMFRLLTDKRETSYDVVTSLKIHDVCLIGKNILQLNELSVGEFDNLGHIKGGSIERVLMKGKVSGDNITSDIPTADELRVSGVGIQATKCFDMAIRDSEIECFGIGVDFLGCDINLIDNCRLAYNQRHFQSTRISTYGSQNKLKNCDVMWGTKKGHIYLDQTRWDTIQDNYFEAYNENGLFIYGVKTIGTDISLNRFDANGTDTPEIKFLPFNMLQIHDNRFNTSGKNATIEVGETYYDQYERHRLACIHSNSGFITFNAPPMYKRVNEKDYFNVDNVPKLDGEISKSYPFEKNESGKWCFKKQSSGSAIITLTPKTKSSNYTVIFNTHDTDGTYHVNIFKNSYGGTKLRSGQVQKGTSSYTFNNHPDLSSVVIEFTTNSVDMESIRLVNAYA